MYEERLICCVKRSYSRITEAFLVSSIGVLLIGEHAEKMLTYRVNQALYSIRSSTLHEYKLVMNESTSRENEVGFCAHTSL